MLKHSIRPSPPRIRRIAQAMRRAIAPMMMFLLAGCAREPSVTTPAPVPTAPVSFTLFGNLNDTAFRPVAQARVEVVDGPQAGTVATSNDLGQFFFVTPFTASLTLRATKDGYATATQSVAPLGSSSRSVTLVLESPNPPVDLEGSYVVAFSADAACTSLPPIARTRTYLARANGGPHDRTTFRVTLSGGAFAGDTFYYYNSFVAGVFRDFVRFSLENKDTAYDIIDQVEPGKYVLLSGRADAIVAGSTIDAAFAGRFAYCEGSQPNVNSFLCSTTPIVCESENHRVKLTRQ